LNLISSSGRSGVTAVHGGMIVTVGVDTHTEADRPDRAAAVAMASDPLDAESAAWAVQSGRAAGTPGRGTPRWR